MSLQDISVDSANYSRLGWSASLLEDVQKLFVGMPISPLVTMLHTGP